MLTALVLLIVHIYLKKDLQKLLKKKLKKVG